MLVLAKGALEHAVPAAVMSATPTSVAAVSLGVATPAVDVTRLVMEVAHLVIRHPARLDRIRVPDQ